MHPKPTITLYRGFEPVNRYIWSPFVTKLEARLRFGGLSYHLAAGSPMSAPRGKIPYIGIASPSGQEQTLDDSSLITSALVEDAHLEDLNRGLGPVEKAQDVALRALLEHRLAFLQTYERWVQNYYTMRDGAMSAIPYPFRVVVGLLAYRKTMTTLHGQGTARYFPDEIATFKREIWESINDLLVAAKSAAASPTRKSDSPFWLSKRDDPSEADATLYGFIASGLVCSAAPEGRTMIRSFPVIMDYARRIHDRYFPDYEMWDQD